MTAKENARVPHPVQFWKGLNAEGRTGLLIIACAQSFVIASITELINQDVIEATGSRFDPLTAVTFGAIAMMFVFTIAAFMAYTGGISGSNAQ